jgi:hypothetical protein
MQKPEKIQEEIRRFQQSPSVRRLVTNCIFQLELHLPCAISPISHVQYATVAVIFNIF